MKATKTQIYEKEADELEYHLQCIKSFVAEADENDESPDLEDYNLYDITSSLFRDTSLETSGEMTPSTSSVASHSSNHASNQASGQASIQASNEASNHTILPLDIVNIFQDLEDYLADVIDPTIEEPRPEINLSLEPPESSGDSTLETPTCLDSTLGTPSPLDATPAHLQRIVSQHCTDTLHVQGTIPENRTTEHDATEAAFTEHDATEAALKEHDATEAALTETDISVTDHSDKDAVTANSSTITYVSPFSLETWGKDEEPIGSEETGARKQIRSVTSLCMTSSLKITQLLGSDHLEDPGDHAGNLQDSGFHSLDSFSMRHKNNSASSLFDGTPTGEADGPPNLSSVWSTPDVPPMTKGVDTSHEVLTTLDRPRTQSGVGTPIRPAWVQVSCYERATQTGNFLIDKHNVKIDGQFLHPELNNTPELYRISLIGLVNRDRPAKTERMLPDIGEGAILCRHPDTGNVTITRISDKDIFILNTSFLNLKGDEKCKGKHLKLEKNSSYTIFDREKFVNDIRNSAIDLSQVHTIGQVAIAFIKINSGNAKGIPCWVKVQCLEAMNLLKNLLTGSSPEDREWLRKEPLEQFPKRASNTRLSFGKAKLSDKCSVSSSSDSSNTPIPRLLRSKKKGGTPPSGRNSVLSHHLQPVALNYACEGDAPPPIRDSVIVRQSTAALITAADVSLPLHRDDHPPS